jgi:hypothetical protein
MARFGPDRRELRFRLIFSLAGLGLLAGGMIYRGMPMSAGAWEAVIIAGLFFGGTLVWSLRQLARRQDPDQ